MIVSTKLKEVLRLLIAENPDIIVGGSFCLKYFGLLDRELGDLDILIDKDSSFSTSKFMAVSDNLELSDFTSDFAGEEIKRTGFKVEGINVCCFQMDKDYLDSIQVEIEGMLIKLQNPCYAIAAKASYQKRSRKHEKDIKDMFIKMLDYRRG